jgi:uncharacterized metal-binding protein YceD (DUF177 family)
MTDKIISKTIPWSQQVAVAHIPEGGLRFEAVAEEAERAALAEQGMLPGVLKARAAFELTLVGGGKVFLKGRVQATVVQTCVVSLDPVENEIDESFEALFLPEPRRPRAGQERAGQEVQAPDDPGRGRSSARAAKAAAKADPKVAAKAEGKTKVEITLGEGEEDEDAPETIVNGMIDATGLATEHLFLGIDPYPRKPGVVFTPVEEQEDPEDHPFAALKSLKDPDER